MPARLDSSTSRARVTATAPTLFAAARVITMAGHDCEAFVVSGDRILAIGRTTNLRERFPHAEVVDFGDAVIVPGFNDTHMHPSTVAEDLLHLDLSSKMVSSIDEIRTKIQAEVATRPAPAWVRAVGYDDGKMSDGSGLRRWDLDEAAPDNPVLVIHVAGHWAVANSAALAVGGINESTVPPDGGSYGRDSTGRLNGILFEQALFDFAYPALSHTGRTVTPRASLDERLGGLKRAVQMFHAAGLTSVGDALVGADEFALLAEAERRGLLNLRVNMLISVEQYDRVRTQVLTLDPGGLLRFNGIKTFVDGAIGGRTCLLEQPFEGTSDDYGIQSRSTEELRDIVRQTNGEGTRLAVHANGDRAISIILDLMEEQQEISRDTHIHNRIEHCTVVTEDILKRMRALGAIAVPFGSYVYYHGSNLLEWYGEARLRRMFAHRWFLDSEVAVAGSSDYPCGPYQPLLGMQSCVTRKGWDGSMLGDNQRITPYEALNLYTGAAAYSTNETSVKGTLRPGLLADFVVLDSDPLTVDPNLLGSIPVRATYVGGRCVFAANRA